jgi:signal transduction histidine kinase
MSISVLRRGKVWAGLLLVLILIAVVGGMTWATFASVRLAEETIKSDRVTRIDRALKGIEQYISFVLSTETTRPYTDYSATFFEDPLSIRDNRDGRQLNSNPNTMDVELASPLLPVRYSDRWRPYDWIDIYFQIDADQRISSPQFPDDPDHIPFYTRPDLRTISTWEWLRRTLPTYPLAEKVAEAQKRDHAEDSFDASVETAGTAEPDTDTRDPDPRLPPRGLRNAQIGFIPPDRCVDARMIARNITLRDASLAPGVAEDELGVTTKYMPIDPPFWFDAEPKLVFVREIHADADILRQGFIGDWERLKPHLMARIRPTFPNAELVPETAASIRPLPPHETRVPILPLTLRVPDFASPARAEAWRSTRGMLLISWLAALAVLLVAGWGVGNLVALTERRMQFAYAVTHELRTPLTTFRLYSDMLSAGLVPEDRKQDYLDTLNRESARLSTLVESVLEYARLENRHAKLHLRETDGASLLNTVAETLEKRCAENGVAARKVNEIKNGLKLRTDVDLVNQISGVLINNACRHALASKDPAVMVRLAGDNGRITLDVADSGPGVDRMDSRRIFKPFRRGRDADRTARGGIGLGLALARNWASLLGGRLDLVHRHDPELGGARFRLTIPSQAHENAN